MSRHDLTAETLREYLNYDPDTGVFTWRKKSSNKSVIGAVAGDVKTKGYRYIQLLGYRYCAHRLAWRHYYGVWPEHCIDHINGVRDDNRIANLRDVTCQINNQNQRASKTGKPFIGVYPYFNKWVARIGANGKLLYLGSFDTPEEARDAYLEAKRKLHAGCTI